MSQPVLTGTPLNNQAVVINSIRLLINSRKLFPWYLFPHTDHRQTPTLTHGCPAGAAAQGPDAAVGSEAEGQKIPLRGPLLHQAYL